MERLHITRATQESLPTIIELLHKGYQVNYKDGTIESKPYLPETYPDDVASGQIRLFVAKKSDQIVGTVQYEDRNGIAYLSQMTVDPDLRNEGIGAQLLQAAENSAQGEGFKSIQLTAMVEKQLPEYYEKFGYVRTGTLVRPAYTLMIMEKVL